VGRQIQPPPGATCLWRFPLPLLPADPAVVAAPEDPPRPTLHPTGVSGHKDDRVACRCRHLLPRAASIRVRKSRPRSSCCLSAGATSASHAAGPAKRAPDPPPASQHGQAADAG
jgi:hypothetical protein